MLLQTLLTPKILRSWDPGAEYILFALDSRNRTPFIQDSYTIWSVFSLIAWETALKSRCVCVFVCLIASLSAWKWESRLRHWEQCLRLCVVSDETAESHVNVVGERRGWRVFSQIFPASTFTCNRTSSSWWSFRLFAGNKGTTSSTCPNDGDRTCEPCILCSCKYRQREMG